MTRHFLVLAASLFAWLICAGLPGNVQGAAFTGSAHGTLYVRESAPGDWQTSADLIHFKPAHYPLRIGKNTALVLASDLTITSPQHYVLIDGSDVIVEGQFHAVSAKGSGLDVPGLFRNGHDGHAGHSRIHLSNIIHEGWNPLTDLSFAPGHDHFQQPGFHQGAKDITESALTVRPQEMFMRETYPGHWQISVDGWFWMNVVSLPLTINTATHVTVVSDLTITSAHHFVVLNADDIVFDGGAHMSGHSEFNQWVRTAGEHYAISGLFRVNESPVARTMKGLHVRNIAYANEAGLMFAPGHSAILQPGAGQSVHVTDVYVVR